MLIGFSIDLLGMNSGGRFVTGATVSGGDPGLDEEWD